MGGEIQPKTPVLHLSVALHTPQFPILSPSRAFSFLCPPILPPLHVRKAHKRKKRRKAATSPPFVALTSTKFNPTSFNLRLELNAPLNRIKPKFNPLQPFAHFVLSPISPQSTRNSLIYRRSTSFRFNPTLYISFSCPYLKTLPVHHANIVYRVKTCYKIKIDFRVPVCCFYGVLMSKLHPNLTIAPLLHSNSATIRQ